jgi:hypothetical protein
MWAGLIHHATLNCFCHCSKADNLNTVHYGGMTACRPHSTTCTTALHSTLPWTQRAVPCKAVGHISH